MWYIVAALIIWSSSFVAAKYAYSVFDPVLTVQLRLIIAALIVSPYFISAYKSIPPQLKKPIWILSLASFPVVLLLQFVGLNYTTASGAVTLVAVEPMMFLVLNHLIFGQKAKLIEWFLCAIAFVGIVLTVKGDMGVGSVSLLGSCLVLMAGLAFALSTLFGKDIIAQVDSKVYTTVTLTLGAVLCLPFTAVLTKNWQTSPTPSALAAIIYLGVFSSWLAYRLWNKGIGSCPANTTAILITLEPIFGILFAMIFLGEKLTPIKTLGCLMVIGAVTTSSLLPILKTHRNKMTSA